jgi:rhamnulokinase/L-fuculokinase
LSGELRQELCRELNIPQSKVIAAAGHDTQCAIAALPSNAPDIAFLSCGTWSLFGTELDSPVLTYESMKDDMSNELGANGKIDYLKNINGLWLIQECRGNGERRIPVWIIRKLRGWRNESEPFRSFIDPDDDIFSSPETFHKKFRRFAPKQGRPFQPISER